MWMFYSLLGTIDIQVSEKENSYAVLIQTVVGIVSFDSFTVYLLKLKILSASLTLEVTKP